MFVGGPGAQDFWWNHPRVLQKVQQVRADPRLGTPAVVHREVHLPLYGRGIWS